MVTAVKMYRSTCTIQFAEALYCLCLATASRVKANDVQPKKSALNHIDLELSRELVNATDKIFKVDYGKLYLSDNVIRSNLPLFMAINTLKRFADLRPKFCHRDTEASQCFCQLARKKFGPRDQTWAINYVHSCNDSLPSQTSTRHLELFAIVLPQVFKVIKKILEVGKQPVQLIALRIDSALNSPSIAHCVRFESLKAQRDSLIVASFAFQVADLHLPDRKVCGDYGEGAAEECLKIINGLAPRSVSGPIAHQCFRRFQQNWCYKNQETNDDDKRCNSTSVSPHAAPRVPTIAEYKMHPAPLSTAGLVT